MKMAAVKLLVKMAGPDGVHMPGDVVYMPGGHAERLRTAGMAVGPDDSMPEPPPTPTAEPGTCLPDRQAGNVEPGKPIVLKPGV